MVSLPNQECTLLIGELNEHSGEWHRELDCNVGLPVLGLRPQKVRDLSVSASHKI